MGQLLKCVINESEKTYMLRKNIAATLLKILCKTFSSAKSFDKSNLQVFATMGKLQVGLNFF